MKQIKTVVEPFERATAFDNNINKLIKDGWEVKKRAVISAKGEPNEVGSCATVLTLYAELEK
jgi:hypothetical protein